MSKKKENEIKITELIEGNAIFESKGISKVKVTKDGTAKALVFPIRSTGVSELIDSFTAQAPKPPIINQVVAPDSEIGKQLGLQQKRHVKTFDLTDKSYLEAKEQYDRDLGLAVMLQGLDIPIKDKAGNEIAERDKKLEVLRSLGMTGNQFMQIAADIQNLTKWKEDQEDSFFD